jgi:hypothetical protein
MLYVEVEGHGDRGVGEAEFERLVADEFACRGKCGEPAKVERAVTMDGAAVGFRAEAGVFGVGAEDGVDWVGRFAGGPGILDDEFAVIP